MSNYQMERLQITDAEREAAWAELRELERKCGREWLGPYFAGYFGRSAELSVMANEPVRREDAVLWVVYDTEYRTSGAR